MKQCGTRNNRFEYTLKKKRVALAVMAALSVVSVNAHAGPAGHEFQVNTYTTSVQTEPAIAMDANGDFVVAWQSFGQDVSHFDIYAQRYDASGNPQGAEFRVNTYTTSSQNSPTVAMDSDGDFVVTWQSISFTGGSSRYDVYVQRFDALGNKQGAEIQVNPNNTSSTFREPVIAMDADGDFVVTWTSWNPDSRDNDVYAQRFDALGNKEGGQIQVNTYVTHDQVRSAVAMDADGDFVVAWNNEWVIEGGGGVASVAGYHVYAQRFDALGNKQGGEILFDPQTGSSQLNPAVAMNADGDFVVTWSGPSGQFANRNVYTQRFDALGNKRGSRIQVNSYTTSLQFDPAIAMDADGDFVVTWQSLIQDGSYYPSIYAQRIDALGNKRGSEIHVNTYTTNEQTLSVVAMDADGDFAVTWQSLVQDGGDTGVYGRRYSISPVTDFNRDHYADIFWRDDVGGQNKVWNMQGLNRLSVNGQTTTATPWRVGGIGDINGDAYPDVVWRNSSTGANLAWLFQPDGSTVNAILPSLANMDWEMQGLGDIDGNGHQDIIWRNTSDGRNAAWRIDTIGGTLNVVAGNLHTASDTNWRIAGIGDVNGDQNADIFWRNINDGRNIVWVMDDLSSQSFSMNTINTQWFIAGTGDLDKDEKMDVVWRNRVTGANFIWLIDDATVKQSGAISSIPNQDWQLVQVADYSGDGSSDLLWRNSASGQNVIYTIHGVSVTSIGSTSRVGNTSFEVQPKD